MFGVLLEAQSRTGLVDGMVNGLHRANQIIITASIADDVNEAMKCIDVFSLCSSDFLHEHCLTSILLFNQI